jgi:hypothetical protein
MDKEWRITDSNTVLDECDECFMKRPVKKMLDPYYKDEDLDEYEFDEEIMRFYCFACYQNELSRLD